MIKKVEHIKKQVDRACQWENNSSYTAFNNITRSKDVYSTYRILEIILPPFDSLLVQGNGNVMGVARFIIESTYIRVCVSI